MVGCQNGSRGLEVNIYLRLPAKMQVQAACRNARVK
jgi:hypothetical protein